MNFSKTKTTVVVVAVLLAGSAFGYWGYSEYKELELRSEVMGIVQDTSLQMRDSLSAEPRAAAASRPASLRKFYEHAEAVDGEFKKLRGLAIPRPVEPLADAADDYVLTSREILLRWASTQRNHQKLSSSIQALRSHMSADDRSGAWVSQAIRAKEQVEEDYRDFQVASNALGNLLETFPAARAKMTPYVEASLLTDDALVEDARRRALEASMLAANEIEKVRQLRPAR
jgi:hypothetical protein